MTALPHDLKKIADEYAALCAAQGQITDLINEVRQPLYHYTSMAGLVGMLQTQQMWLTSVFHLNDPSELAYGINVALEALAAASDNAPPEVQRFCVRAKRILLKSGREFFGWFVGSMSAAPNDLGQWRAYADNGRGVAIGLAPSLFKIERDSRDLPLLEKFQVARVNYRRTTLEDRIRVAVEGAVAAFAKAKTLLANTEAEEAFGREMATHIATPLFMAAISTKDPAFALEREFRIVLVNDYAKLVPHLLFRTRGSSLVPYISISMDLATPSAITSITVGPAADDVAVNAVETLLRRYGLSSSLVSKSEIAYRAQ